MKTKITLHFYAKSTKANAQGLVPIYVRLTVDGKRLEFSTKKFMEKSRWSGESSKMKGTTEEARSFNSYLDLIKSKVLDVRIELLHQNEALTIENFKNKKRQNPPKNDSKKSGRKPPPQNPEKALSKTAQMQAERTKGKRERKKPNSKEIEAILPNY